MSQLANPYWGNSFWEFFITLGHRIGQAFLGKLPLEELASDEIQFLVLIFLSFSAALLGTFLVLRKMTMLANSLSHTVLLGIVLTFLIVKGEQSLTVLLIASLVTGVFTTFFTEFLNKGMGLQKDASIGLVFTTLFALGIILVSLFTRHSHLGIDAIMGNVDALHLNDLKQVFFLFLINLSITVLFFKQFEITTFDPTLAKNFGISLVFFNYLLMVQTAATAIGAFRAVGAFLFLALLVTPVLTARLLTNRLIGVFFLSALIGLLASLISVAFSRHLLSCYEMPIATSGLSVLVLAIFFILAINFYRVRQRAS